MKDLNSVDMLIVEDDPRDVELTMRVLRKNKLAKNILVVQDGVEALDFFFCRGKFSDRNIQMQPKVVLLDLKLPKVSGMEVLRLIKKDDQSAKIPIVIVTSSGEEPEIKEAYALGVNSYVVKPVDFNQFVKTLSTVSMYWLLINEPLK